MQIAIDDHEHRLMPMSAGEYYSLRYKLACAADEMRKVASGAPISLIEIEEWWLEVTAALATIDNAWFLRRPNLRVVK